MDKFRMIRQQVTCRQVLEDKGTILKNGRCPCPIHHGTHLSFKVYDDGYYYCHKCHASGDVTSLVAKLENLSMSEAANWLIERYGLNIDRLAVEDAETAQRKRYLAMVAALRRLYDLGTRLYDYIGHPGWTVAEALQGCNELLEGVEVELKELKRL